MTLCTLISAEVVVFEVVEWGWGTTFPHPLSSTAGKPLRVRTGSSFAVTSLQPLLK